jgi:hypothetical protein
MPSRAHLTALLLALALGIGAAQAPAPSPAASAAFQGKVDGIRTRGLEEATAAPAPAAAQRTVIEEGELNAWLAIEIAPRLAPRGIVDPAVTLLADNRVTSTAVVDLETVRGPAEPSLFDAFSLLQGRVPMTLTGRLVSDAGEARLDVEHASVAGLTVPSVLLQQLLTRASRSPERPEGFRLDAPFPLPAGIVVGQGRAVVVQ